MVIPPEEEQSQLIASPDGKFQILNHSSRIEYMGGYCVTGAVKYVGPEPNLSAEVKAYYYIDKELIDTEVTAVDFLEPGRTRAFYILYSGQRCWEIQYYKLEIHTIKEETLQYYKRTYRLKRNP